MTLQYEQMLPAPLPSPQDLRERYLGVRQFSEELCQPLLTEDYVIQSMPDVSPTKWHLAHVSWFFETFVLQPAVPDYRPCHPRYAYLFNSYYQSVGERHCRPKRGLISRPTVEETYAYRHFVDEQVLALLERLDEQRLPEIAPFLVLGLHHEQQHQELMLTDIKHVFSCNPLAPVYQACQAAASPSVAPLKWVSFPEALAWIGHEGPDFAYDNESPRHREFLPAFQLASRLITNGEYLQFMSEGGYHQPLLWLSAGWNTVCRENWQAPLYWEEYDGEWWMMTLSGKRRVDLAEPVCHLSYFEADAFARWAGARLPTEAEWEVAARTVPMAGNLVESRRYHPAPAPAQDGGERLTQIYGDVWEWTRSAYAPYPGYQPSAGAVGEYNGKFMCNQYVLRGGSCATSLAHIRPTYRNFFPTDARWQFTGLRLAKDLPYA